MGPTAIAAAALHDHAGLRCEAEWLERALQRLGLAPPLDDAALDALVDALTVRETSFFRHPAQFEALGRHVLPKLTEPITVWSAGCATGQEAYSVAMLLSELGAEHWQVIATDVNRDALERTARGCYGPRELRGLDATRLARHGHATPSGWQVHSALLERVVTVRHRIAHDPLPVPAGTCQVILCRNVLIYLAPDAVQRVLERAHAALAPGGRLLLGGAEALVHRVPGLLTEQIADTFAYRRARAGALDVSLKRECAKSVG